MNNKKITSPNKLVMFAIIPAILALAIGMNVPTAEATSNCEVGTNCYAFNYFTDDKAGVKYDIKVTNLGPSCASGTNHEPTITGWVLFPNNYFIENGFTSGDLAGSCYTTEKAYYGYRQSGNPVEINSASVYVGNSYTFSIDDINANKYWTVKRDSSTLASGIYMAYTHYAEAWVGMEGNVNNPGSSWIPETEIRNVKEYGTSWVSPTTIGQYSPDTSLGYHMDQCTSIEDLDVGTTGVSC